MTKGAGSPAKARNFFSMMPERTTAAMPVKKADTATQGEPPDTAPAKRLMMGSLAPQGMNPVVMTVIFRSRSCSMVREARMRLVTTRSMRSEAERLCIAACFVTACSTTRRM